MKNKEILINLLKPTKARKWSLVLLIPFLLLLIVAHCHNIGKPIFVRNVNLVVDMFEPRGFDIVLPGIVISILAVIYLYIMVGLEDINKKRVRK